MIQTALKYGIQTAAEDAVPSKSKLSATVGQQIDLLLRDIEGNHAERIRTALGDPQATIELRAGDTVQVVTPDTPLRELVPAEGELEITVSLPHAGG